MRTIIVGCGKVGYTLAKNLSFEYNVDLAIIDSNSDSFSKAAESVESLFVRGNGLKSDVLIEAGVKEADLVICTMDADETNILCCVLAKRLGARHTMARVRNPEYALEWNKVWKELGLEMIINPEYETAREISRLLRFPTVDDIDTFVNGRVELVSFKVSEAKEFFVGKSVEQIFHKKKMNVLLATIERDDSVIIPHGDFVFKDGDIIRILGRPSNIMDFFTHAGKNTDRIRNATIIGGGKITYYLAELLHRHSKNTEIKIIEIDKDKCELLSEKFPRCVVINADGTDENIVLSEIAGHTSAVICLTDRDEVNTIMALYSLQVKVRKVILKINYINKNIVKDLGFGSIVSPQSITSDQIIRYMRGLSNVSGGDIMTVYKIFDNGEEKIEAVEFSVQKQAKCLDKPIKLMKLKKGILIGCIVRNSNIIMPTGETFMQVSDSVIIIAKNDKILELDDIMSN